MKTNTDEKETQRMSRADRGAQTRQNLLEITIECLADLGYAKMSTNDVVKRTGVSRGALAHHFPSKAHLVAEAAAYLISRRIKYSVAKFKALKKGDHDLRAQLETKWKAYEKWFPANIEFMVASRTDPALREHFTSAINRYAEELSDLQMETFHQDKIVLYVTGCFIRGLCLERLVNEDALIDDIFDEFVRIMKTAFPDQ